ncbi:unnamed protein product [Heterobilharzia americana]|nr:unnamed protein product [Heterobilharzia americana]
MINCPSCSITSIQGRIAALQESENNLKASVANKTEACNSLQILVEEGGKMKNDLFRFCNSRHLSEVSILNDMRSMEFIKRRYGDLSKLNSQSLDHKFGQSTGENLPDQRLLMTWKKEVEELKERKEVLSNHINRYMGISTDTKLAKSQLGGALTRMRSMDSYLVRTLGVNAWNKR